MNEIVSDLAANNENEALYTCTYKASNVSGKIINIVDMSTAIASSKPILNS